MENDKSKIFDLITELNQILEELRNQGAGFVDSKLFLKAINLSEELKKITEINH